MKAGKLKVSGGCATDIGIVRKVNQDAVFFEAIHQQGESFAVGAVCDGIGGMQSGEEASALVIEEISRWFWEVSGWIDIQKTECDILFAHMKDAAEQWNQDLIDFCRQQKIRSGTTMSAIMIIRSRFYILQAGDSRIYRYREQLEQLTEDDTVIKSFQGKNKAYLTNYVGKTSQLQFASLSGELRRGDVFIYCSDGFYHRLEEADIKQYVQDYKRKQPLDVICQTAVHMMEQRRETDNISAGLIIIEASRNSFSANLWKSL